jgi:hypothetical protein
MSKRSFALRARLILALTLAVTYAVVVVLDLAPHEKAGEVAFIIAQLLAAEAIGASYRQKHHHR